MNDFSFQRYLAAKRTVDDWSINTGVWQQLQFSLNEHVRWDKPLQILELGCGTGTMLARMWEGKLFHQAVYTGIDEDAKNIQTAIGTHLNWMRTNFSACSDLPTGYFGAENGNSLEVHFIQAEVQEFLLQQTRQWDLLVAHAFLDLIDVPGILPLVLERLNSGGCAYFTVNFDGLTTFEPVVDPVLDERIEQAYHQSMDRRKVNGRAAGHSRTGRKLFEWLRQAGMHILAAGSSDWVVYGRDGRYLADEDYFLKSIIHFIEEELKGKPEFRPGEIEDWAAVRMEQIRRGELVYITHQLDFLAVKP